MKTILTLLILFLISGCVPTKPDGTPARCAAESWGGVCYGSTEEGMYHYNKSMLQGQINYLKIRNGER